MDDLTPKQSTWMNSTTSKRKNYTVLVFGTNCPFKLKLCLQHWH